PDSLVLDLGSADISSNEPVCIPVSVTGFEDIVSSSFSLQFDNSLFEYINFDNLAIPGATIDASLANAAGIITFSYDGAAETLANGSVLFEICLQADTDAIPGTCSPFEMINIPVPPQAFTSQNPTINIGILDLPGEHCVLFPEGFGIILEDASQGIDSSFCTPVRVISYDNILEADFNLNFDPTLLEFVEINTITSPPNFTVMDGGPGILNFTTTSGTPVNIPDSTIIFEVCFNTLLTPDCAPFFGTTNSEPSSTTTNGDGSILFTDAEICVEDRLIINSVTVIPASCADACDGEIAFDISGGNGLIFVRDQSRPFVTFSDDTIRNVCAGWVVYDVFNNGTPSVSETDSVFVTFDPAQQAVANIGDQDTISLGCGGAGNVIVGGPGNVGSEYTLQLFNETTGSTTIIAGPNPVPSGGSILEIVSIDGIIILETRSEAGCTATDTVVVTPPVFPIAEAGPVDTALTCDNEPLILSGEGSSDDGFFSYMWVQFSGSVPVDTISETQAAVIDSAGRYVLIVTNAQTMCSSSDEILVSDERDPPNIGVPITTSLGCNGEPAELNTGLFGNNFVHQWLDESGNPDGNSPEYTADLPGTYTITVTNTVNGCESTEMVTVEASGGNPVVNQPMFPTSIYCTSDSTPILVTYDNVSPSANFTWTTEDGDLAIGQSNVAQPIVLAPGTYSVVVNDNGCIDSTDVIVVGSVFPQVEAGDDVPLDCDSPTLIDASGGTSEGGFSYQWLYEGDTIVNATDIQTFAENGLGVYTIIVTNDVTGCAAQDDVEVIGSLEVPAVSLPDTAGLLTCEADSLVITPSVTPAGPNYTFIWSGAASGSPQGDGSSYVATGGGLIAVTVTNENSGCGTTIETFVDESFGEPPFVALTRDTIGITCDQPIRTLDGSLSSGGDNFTYVWDNFEDGEEPNMQGNDSLDVGTAGTYTLTVINTETQCRATDTIYVVDTRVFPMVDTLPIVPLDCDNQMTTIGVELLVGDPENFTVIWSEPAVCNDVELPSDFVVEVECGGTYAYTVINTLSGCFTNGTVRVETSIDTAASIEFVEPDVFDCTSTSLTLEATYSGMDAPDMVSWESLDGNTITPPNGSLIVSVDGPGLYVVTVESPSACEVTDTLEVLADQNTPVADAGMDFEVLCNEPVSLDGSNSSQGPDFTYLWIALQGGIDPGSDPTQQTVLASGPGLYVLQVTNETNLCADSDTILVTSEETPADAGPDQFICGDSTCVSATPPAGFVGEWTAMELNGAIFDPNAGDNTACVTGITQPVILVWTISLASGTSPECDDADTVVINPATAPEAIDDNLLVNNADGTGTIDLALNDNTSGPFTIALLGEPEFGSFTSNINGRLSYQAPAGISGTFTVDYEICASDCAGLCDQGTLTVRVEAEGTEPEIYNAITPNDDGLNDRFVFEVLEFGDPQDFPDNEFILFNRWGDILYEAKPYLNEFNGTLPDGTVLAEGTYYYILRLNLGEGLIFRGDLTIVR
ncbi:MAG: gliding motility-associated C-terminal domain-containing protein, partial [Bacteroidota bacterium]